MTAESVHYFVLAPGCVDLSHVEHAVARELGMDHYELSVGSLIYQQDLREPSMNVVMSMASAYQLELRRFTEDPVEKELSEVLFHELGTLFSFNRARFWE